MSDVDLSPEELLIRWFLDLLERPGETWNETQRSYLVSLLRTPEGARTLGKLAATTARLRKTGFAPAEMGDLGAIHSALEAFWKDPSPGTYRDLGIARW
jgi:hypothetical protein